MRPVVLPKMGYWLFPPPLRCQPGFLARDARRDDVGCEESGWLCVPLLPDGAISTSGSAPVFQFVAI